MRTFLQGSNPAIIPSHRGGSRGLPCQADGCPVSPSRSARSQALPGLCYDCSLLKEPGLPLAAPVTPGPRSALPSPSPVSPWAVSAASSPGMASAASTAGRRSISCASPPTSRSSTATQMGCSDLASLRTRVMASPAPKWGRVKTSSTSRSARRPGAPTTPITLHCPVGA